MLCVVTFQCLFFCFFFNDTATTEIYTLSLHDALPILAKIQYNSLAQVVEAISQISELNLVYLMRSAGKSRSEEHTSELQSHSDLVCRLLLEKKNT